MAGQTTEQFIEALRTLEQTEDLGPITQLFAEDCRVGNLSAPEKFIGRDGARKFWAEYCGAFDTIESKFRNVIITENRAALEWTSQATIAAPGALAESPSHEAAFQYDSPDEGIHDAQTNFVSVTYSGVSILEIEANQITRFCAYFNPSALTPKS